MKWSGCMWRLPAYVTLRGRGGGRTTQLNVLFSTRLRGHGNGSMFMHGEWYEVER